MGIQIEVDRQVPEGFLLELWIEVSDHPTKFYLAGEVKWCQELDDGKGYLVGVELKKGETEDLSMWQKVVENCNAASHGEVREA